MSDSETEEVPAAVSDGPEDLLVEERENTCHKIQVFDEFSRLKTEEKVCDFIIEIEGEEIHVHRAVLVASSKYYEAMLTHDTAEKKSGRVEIHGVELDAGKQCIDYMYTGKVKFSLKNPENLIHAAELMQLPSLTDMYFEFLKEKLSAKNCLKYVQLAETFNRRSFAEFFKKSSAENFADIIESEDFPNISLTLLEQCLSSSPGTGWDTEASKWTAISKWVNVDLENREESFLQLFGMLKLENLTEEFLKNKVMAEPLVKNSTECKEIILNAFLSSTKSNVVEVFDRKSAYLIACQSDSRMLLRYEMETKKWSRFVRIPADVYQKKIDIVSVNGEVYLTSGDEIGKFGNGNLIHLRETGHQPAYHQCVAHGTVIYIIFTDQTCKYDTRDNKWNVLPTKHALGDGFFIASSNQFIYAMGGIGTDTYAREFDFKSEAWEPISKMCLGRGYGAAVCSDERVYVLGGHTGFNDQWHENEYYSPEGNVWTILSSNIKCLHYNCKALCISGKVYIVGGVKTTKTTFSNAHDVKCFSCRRNAASSNPYRFMPYVAEIDLKQSTSAEITSMKTDTGLACAVYTD